MNLFLAVFFRVGFQVGKDRKGLVAVLTLTTRNRYRLHRHSFVPYLEPGIGEFLISMFIDDMLFDIVIVNTTDPALLLISCVCLTVK